MEKITLTNFEKKLDTLARSRNMVQAHNAMRALIGQELHPFPSANKARVIGVEWDNLSLGQRPENTSRYAVYHKTYNYSVRPAYAIRVYYEYV